MTITLEQLNAASQAEFTALLEGIYEHSPWIAEAAYAQRENLHTVLELHAAMKDAVGGASREKKLALIKAHPDLACAEAEPADGLSGTASGEVDLTYLRLMALLGRSVLEQSGVSYVSV